MYKKPAPVGPSFCWVIIFIKPCTLHSGVRWRRLGKCTDCCNLLTPWPGALQDTLAYQCRGWWRSSGSHQSGPHWFATRHFLSWASISSWKASLKPDCGSSQYLPDVGGENGNKMYRWVLEYGGMLILGRSLAATPVVLLSVVKHRDTWVYVKSTAMQRFPVFGSVWIHGSTPVSLFSSAVIIGWCPHQ